MMRLAAALLLLAPSAMAEEGDPAPFMPALTGCLSAAASEAEEARCENVVFTACQMAQGEDERHTTLAMANCALAEAGAWDLLLNRYWPDLRAQAREEDADDETTARADALVAAQRAWIAWRDADCAFEYARWGRGSARHVAGHACLAARTAARVRKFRSWLRER